MSTSVIAVEYQVVIGYPLPVECCIIFVVEYLQVKKEENNSHKK